MSAFEAWAVERGLRRSMAAHCCLHWVAKGLCDVTVCLEDRNRHRWMNHVSGWVREGKRLLICEPYQLAADDLADLNRSARQFGLDVVVHSGGGYGHGTICIELTKQLEGSQ